jgi:glycosyltransferase involved in cell wall biosynthesis
MKIAILGTRGIPNHYGGFEQYAELFSVYLVQQGFEVTVYNSHNHPYQDTTYKGVTIKHIYDPEKNLGTIGQFFYDLGCILDTRKQNFDVVYQLGYTSSAIFNFLFKSKTLIVTNMDGMEWKRSKYNKYVQKFLMYSERIAVKNSHFFVADSLGIKEYLDKKYSIDSFYSAYTAEIPANFSLEGLAQFELNPQQYNLLVARLEPENNIETIIAAHTINHFDFPLIVIGNQNNKYGNYLQQKFKNHKNIRFVGAIYKKSNLDNLRHHSNLYFHGHSVGGTNPSLLEAMACSCSIVAHNNIFNKSVLGDEAQYFNDVEDLFQILEQSKKSNLFFEQAKISNLKKIETIFSEKYVFRMLKEKLTQWFFLRGS